MEEISKANIIDKLAREKFVEKTIHNIAKEYDDDLKDLAQDIYITLLEKPDDKIIDLFNKNQLNYYITRILINNIISVNSPYYYRYKKNKKMQLDIEKYINANYEEDWNRD